MRIKKNSEGERQGNGSEEGMPDRGRSTRTPVCRVGEMFKLIRKTRHETIGRNLSENSPISLPQEGGGVSRVNTGRLITTSVTSRHTSMFFKMAANFPVRFFCKRL